MDAVITSSTYDIIGNELFLRFFGRNEDGTRAELTCKADTPYFYIETKEFHEKIAEISANPLVTGYKHDGINLYNKPLTKIEVQYPFHVPKIRDGFIYTYEADVPYTKRFRYDHGIRYAISYPADKKILEPKDLHPIHKYNITPVHHIIDIETDDRYGFIKPEKANAPVLSFGFYDPKNNTFTCIINLQDRNVTIDKTKVVAHLKELYQRIPENIRTLLGNKDLTGKLKIVTARNEVELYAYYQDYLESNKPDILMGWNNINYDMPYIETRAKNEGLPLPNHKKLAWFDAMEGYDTLHENALPSKKLEDCAQETLGYGKMPREKVCDMWQNDPERFIAYNLWDCVLVELINKIRTILPYFIKIIELSGCEFEDVLYSSRIVDSYIFFILLGKVRLPSLYKIEKRTIKGAYVKDPAKGVHIMSGVLDLKSQYPLTSCSLNASPETAIYSNHCIEKDGKYYVEENGKMILVNKSPLRNLYFQTEPRGLLPICIVRLIEERDDIKQSIKELANQGLSKESPEMQAKNEMQRALKYLTNSFYGVISSSYYRLANDDVGETITTISQRIIRASIALVEEQGYPVIYSDTDSLIVEFGQRSLQESLQIGNKLADLINSNFTTILKEFVSNLENLSFQIKFETIYEVYFQTRREEESHGQTRIVGKKRYIGLIGWDENHGDMTALPIEKRIKIRGFETRRRNTSKTTYNIQMDLFKLILQTKGKNLDDKLTELYRTTRKTFLRGDYGRDIFVRAVLSKPLSEYGGKGDTSYVTAFKVATQLFEQDLELGDTFYWAYIHPGTINLREEGPANAIGLNFDKVNWEIRGTEVIVKTSKGEYHAKLDMERMFQRNIIQPTSTILQHGLDINIDKLLMKMSGQNTLPFL